MKYNISIVSGEGEGEGTTEQFTGRQTARAIRRRLTAERCGGDRWAFVVIDGERVRDTNLNIFLSVNGRKNGRGRQTK